MHLGYQINGQSAAQRSADMTCFARIGQAVASGFIGPPAASAGRCYAQARDYRSRPGNSMARFMAWFKEQLQANEHEWDQLADVAV